MNRKTRKKEYFVYRIEPTMVSEVSERTESYVVHIKRPEDVFRVFRHLGRKTQECLYVVCLNSGKRLIGYTEVARGGTNFAYVEMKHLLLPAILTNAESAILVHNHPSGDPEPSGIDIELTKKAKISFNMMGIDLVDHIILTANGYTSLLERSMI